METHGVSAALVTEIKSGDYKTGGLNHFEKAHTTTAQNTQPFSSCLRKAFRPRKCPLCAKTFFNNGDLNRHYRVHTGEKPYKCAYCPKRFAHLYNLKVHCRTHTGEKPYPCDHCGKTFRSSSDRKKHLRIHTGEKPFCCAICGSCFSQSSTLKLHAVTHGPEGRRAAFLFVDCGNTEEQPQNPKASENHLSGNSSEENGTEIKAV